MFLLLLLAKMFTAPHTLAGLRNLFLVAYSEKKILGIDAQYNVPKNKNGFIQLRSTR
jgi:hypothetical protein